MSHRCLALVVFAVLMAPAAARAEHPNGPPLPAPTGRVVNVSTEPQLQAAVSSLTSDTTIMVAPGTYQLTGTLHVHGVLQNVAIRGASGNRDDVVLVGRGMTNANHGGVPSGIWTGNGVRNITIANLTVRDVYTHCLILNAGTQAPRLYNVRFMNAGEQIVKGNPDGAGGGVDDGVVEYSVFEFSTTSRDWYTNGVDILTGRRWKIRHNLFRNIRAPQGALAGPAVLMWRNAADTITEGNTFIDCQRAIAYGLEAVNGNDHAGGIIRNNFVYRRAGQAGDAGIAVFASPDTVVANNTILLSGNLPECDRVQVCGVDERVDLEQPDRFRHRSAGRRHWHGREQLHAGDSGDVRRRGWRRPSPGPDRDRRHQRRHRRGCGHGRLGRAAEAERCAARSGR